MTERPAHSLPAQRRAAISQLVVDSEAVRVADLAARFGVNAATIRRDLQALEQQGKLRRVHGGAVGHSAAGVAGAPKDSQPARIGRAAAGLIEDGETVFLGPGGLSLSAARCLSNRARLTVVTNAIEVAHWLAGNTPHSVIVTGGQADGRCLGLGGQIALEALAHLRADQVILQLDGVSAVGGLTVDSLAQAEIARAIIEMGARLIVLVEAQRLGRVAAAHIAPASEADVLVTLREAPSAYLWDLSEAGVRIVLG